MAREIHQRSGRRNHPLIKVNCGAITPTLIDLAGGKAADHFDGTSFSAVLQGKADRHRDFAYGIHNNVPEGPSYPSRSVSDGRWRYIRNLTPDEIYIQKWLMGIKQGGQLNNPYWGTWLFASAAP